MATPPADDPDRTPRIQEPPTVHEPVGQPRTHPYPPPKDAPTLCLPAGAPPAVVACDAVPGYHLLEELGRGGMGVVYKARQTSLNRLVALKMILTGAHAGREDLQRFHREAEAAARLQHPNIVQIHEVGVYHGMPFLSLEFCDAGSVSARLQGKPLPSKEAAALVEILARAIHAAHLAGVVHRDLKPANILLQTCSTRTTQPAEETLCALECEFRVSDFVPKVTDFGLAKRIGTESAPRGLTRTGEVMGTPSYMAPEQACGDTQRMGPACDIYGLGAILYELLTGRPPFLAPNHLDTILQVVSQEPLPPRMINRQIDVDLERIALKCLEKNPEQRYTTALELAEDLRRYLNGEPISARSANLLERLHRELAHSQYDAQLRPWGTALIGLGVVILIAQLAVSLMIINGFPWWLSYWIPRLTILGSLVPLWIRYRPSHSLWPTNAVERGLWAVWVGYFLTFSSLFWVMKVMHDDHLKMYGAMLSASGLAWFAMGGYVWGGCYLIGLTFLVLAPFVAMLHGSEWSPFWFGVLWAMALFIIGERYRRLGRAPTEVKPTTVVIAPAAAAGTPAEKHAPTEVDL
jgi:serine/threonine protein kinase